MSMRTARLDYIPGLRPIVSIFGDRQKETPTVAKPANPLDIVPRMSQSRRNTFHWETTPGTATYRPANSKARPVKGQTEQALLVKKLREQDKQSVRWIAAQCRVAASTVSGWGKGEGISREALLLLRRAAK